MSLAVAHLVRGANGLEPFMEFMDSYEKNAAGADHDLVLLLKGVEDGDLLDAVRERAAAHRPAEVRMDDVGYDLTAYVAAASQLTHTRLCFINSYSEILVEGWLAMLDEPVALGGAGAAGATASWASSLAFSMWQSGVPGGYGDVFTDRRYTRRVTHAMAGHGFRNDRLFVLENTIRTLAGAHRFALFPSMHLRTNAFVIDRALLLSVATGRLKTKNDTYRMESGRGNLSAQLRGLGRDVLVVDRHGVARTGRDWPQANVFWQERQQDLLVADNQTRAYADGHPIHRDTLSKIAWGPLARPWPA